MTPESIVKKKLRAKLDMCGHYYFMAVQSGYGKRTVDFLVCRDGAFVAIETKRKGVRKVTPQQAIIFEAIKRAGGECWLVTLDDDDELLWIRQ